MVSGYPVRREEIAKRGVVAGDAGEGALELYLVKCKDEPTYLFWSKSML